MIGPRSVGITREPSLKAPSIFLSVTVNPPNRDTFIICTSLLTSLIMLRFLTEKKLDQSLDYIMNIVNIVKKLILEYETRGNKVRS